MDGRFSRTLAFSLIAIGIAGCAANNPRNLSSNMFIAPASPQADPADAPAPTPADSIASPDIAPPLETPTTLPTTQPLVAVAPDTTAPATQPLQGGVYMTLGGVVADVNGTPIYANTLLSMLDKEFSVKAKEMDPEEFRRFARIELEKAREASIQDEVRFAAADQGLTPDEKKIIDAVMTQYMQKKITDAGGSVELAKRRALADGLTFEQLLHKQLRLITWDLYSQHHILPRVQVSVDDMREFYHAKVNELYSQRNQARFRVIMIDPARLGGPDPKAAARERIRLIRSKAVRGDDFASLASSENHDDYLKARGGDPGGWIERDSYRIDAVDKAIWKIQPGEVTDVVEDDGLFYIAKLEDRKIGKTQPFDDPAVQSDILNRLRTQQLSVLYDELEEKLESEAVVRGKPGDSLLDPAVDIAMQRYAQWTAR
jgi:parvulin-like peptidyl-prolyl isomerase